MNKPSKKTIDDLMYFYKCGNINKVEEITSNLLKDYPDFYFLWKILGLVYLQKKKFNDSITVNKRAIELNSNDFETYFNLAINYNNIGNLKEAEINYKKAIDINPYYYQAYNNLGLLLDNLDKLEESQAYIMKAVEINPLFSDGYFNLAYIQKKLNKKKESIDNYKKSIEINPNNYLAYNNLAIIYNELSKLDIAISYFEKAISIKKDFIDAWVNYFEILEKSNDIDLFEEWINKIPHYLLLKSSDLKYFHAKLLIRRKKLLEALKLLSNIKYQNLNLNRRIDYFNLLGNCHDKLKNFDKAHQAFVSMNELLEEVIYVNKFDSNIYYQKNHNQLKILKKNKLKVNFEISKADDFNPVFLIGFPRSGTTLLDAILSSHSKIEVIEEKPLINEVKSYLYNSEFDIDNLNEIPKSYFEEGRNIYQKNLKKILSTKINNLIIIDKLPLNIFNLPLIHNLFPKSKIIVSIRHPLDSILSCWMQNFKLNNAMANFTSIDKSVELYVLAMDTLEFFKNNYQLNLHYVFYERLIKNFEDECLGVLNFLDLSWEDPLYKFWETALNKKIIKTPSYSQVINPIYENSINRWKDYSIFLKQYHARLEPWYKLYGY